MSTIVCTQSLPLDLIRVENSAGWRGRGDQSDRTLKLLHFKVSLRCLLAFRGSKVSIGWRGCRLKPDKA
jgi:hypothetical protein